MFASVSVQFGAALGIIAWIGAVALATVGVRGAYRRVVRAKRRRD